MDIAIYLEGGGDSAESKAALRLGMSGFLKPLVDLARQRRQHWSVIPCGGRGLAFDSFCNALEQEPDVFNVLLVDSETAIAAQPPQPREHLRQRDGWDLSAAHDDQVHLMAQCMEAWLTSDPETLANYYGQNFNGNSLSRRINLEQEPKAQIYSALDAATRQTQKGIYGKIKHASEILKRIDQEKVKNRCPNCRRFFDTITGKI